MDPYAAPDDEAGPAVLDLVAEDLAALALDLARRRTAGGVLEATTEAAVGLVPGATHLVASLLRHAEVEILSATDPDVESCEAWQLALGSGPAVAATDDLGTAVRVDDLATDPRWVHLHLAEAVDGLPSVLSVAVALPTSSRTLVLSWYGRAHAAFAAPDCSRVALLAAAHTCVALDRGLNEDNLRSALTQRQVIGQAVGILAVEGATSLDTAFAQLAARSQQSNTRLADVARQVVQEHG